MLSLILGGGRVYGLNVASTPPMGFNTWNLYGCGVNAQILKDTAQAVHDSGLQAVGYEYINSDDCWMLAARDAQGRQVANPDKFPEGFAAVATFIHSLGLKSGLYTAKGPNTCAGFAASCKHEVQDAAQWAQWGIDYVKDDSCSECRSNDTLDYMTMWSAIQNSSRPMVLTVEGNPDNTVCSQGGCGNAKRVGHDITSVWASMLSLIDIGSGLWSYAHNGSTGAYGGWWNDLDMLEIGNGDFACEKSTEALQMCQTHFTMWTLMKAPLLLGNDLTHISNATLSVVTNKQAISVNQDSNGIQGKRVSIQLPKNVSYLSSNNNNDNIAVVNRCDVESAPTQVWVWKNMSRPVRDELFLTACNPQDVYQQWSFNTQQKGLLKNIGTQQCVDASVQSDPVKLAACTSSPQQQWTVLPNGHIFIDTTCLDVPFAQGPDIQVYPCKAAGDPSDNNQEWVVLPGGLLQSKAAGVSSNSCLSASMGVPGGTLSTTDAFNRTWCLTNFFGSEGGWGGAPCTGAKNQLFSPAKVGGDVPGYRLTSAQGSPSWNNQAGASGPFPHTRYIQGYSWTQSAVWGMDPSRPGPVAATDLAGILDDDLLGHVKVGGDFCLDLTTGGMLEVWASPLTGGRVAVVLFNRSPAADVITAFWQDLGLNPQSAYSVYDIWQATEMGKSTASYTASVPAHAVAYLILSPA